MVNPAWLNSHTDHVAGRTERPCSDCGLLFRPRGTATRCSVCAHKIKVARDRASVSRMQKRKRSREIDRSRRAIATALDIAPNTISDEAILALSRHFRNRKDPQP